MAGGSRSRDRGSRNLTAAALSELFIDTMMQNPGAAILVASDIDDTLKTATTTGFGSTPSGVIRALAEMNGADHRVFVAVATGRNPGDADRAFPRYSFPTIAKDGRYIRYFDGREERIKMPPMAEFAMAADKLLKDPELFGVSLIDVDDALGLAFPYMYKSRYDKAVRDFKRMRDARLTGDIAIYDHPHEALELIVQSGLHTKGTGVKKLVRELKSSRMGFSKVIVFTFGNSSNDESMHAIADYSVRISPGNTCANFRIETVADFQGAIMLIAGALREYGFTAKGI
jgi:hydroxymethylpyrimidine pyrophosphatase-like HAD family hydrolase